MRDGSGAGVFFDVYHVDHSVVRAEVGFGKVNDPVRQSGRKQQCLDFVRGGL